ncbi:MAG: response regulator [Pseudomonadota bacterium]
MNRVLFVDDEPMVLEALRNALRGKRKEWDMVFNSSAVLALQELERTPVDVIVSDMRMPEMDGAEFLSRASKVCPGATRIILSGQMEESALARAAVTAHRYLTKPCANAQLCECIRRAMELRALLGNEQLRACVGGIESLPSVPSVYRALSEALLADLASPETIANIVQKDVGISAKLLQLVNSAFFGLPRQTTSLPQAVHYLGLATIRSLVLSHSVFAQLGQGNAAFAEEGHEHALACAGLARQLMKRGPEAELAFTAGLLHDVGSLVLASRLPREYALICECAEATGRPLHVVEHERLGVSHADVGAYLLGLWGLPHEVLDIVAFHHAPWTESLPLDAASAVRLAEAICLEATAGAHGLPLHAERPPDGWIERMGVASEVRAARARGNT